MHEREPQKFSFSSGRIVEQRTFTESFTNISVSKTEQHFPKGPQVMRTITKMVEIRGGALETTYQKAEIEFLAPAKTQPVVKYDFYQDEEVHGIQIRVRNPSQGDHTEDVAQITYAEGSPAQGYLIALPYAESYPSSFEEQEQVHADAALRDRLNLHTNDFVDPKVRKEMERMFIDNTHPLQLESSEAQESLIAGRDVIEFILFNLYGAEESVKRNEANKFLLAIGADYHAGLYLANKGAQSRRGKFLEDTSIAAILLADIAQYEIPKSKEAIVFACGAQGVRYKIMSFEDMQAEENPHDTIINSINYGEVIPLPSSSYGYKVDLLDHEIVRFSLIKGSVPQYALAFPRQLPDTQSIENIALDPGKDYVDIGAQIPVSIGNRMRGDMFTTAVVV